MKFLCIGKKKRIGSFRLSVKGLALCCALDSGLIPTTSDGESDTEAFSKFGDMLLPILVKHGFKPDN